MLYILICSIFLALSWFLVWQCSVSVFVFIRKALITMICNGQLILLHKTCFTGFTGCNSIYCINYRYNKLLLELRWTGHVMYIYVFILGFWDCRYWRKFRMKVIFLCVLYIKEAIWVSFEGGVRSLSIRVV